MSSRDPKHLLQPHVLLSAYAQGLFPMAMPDGSLLVADDVGNVVWRVSARN